MSDYFLGELRIFPYPSTIPTGWQPCDGRLLQISANQALFALLGMQFGGDGKTTFALPDLRGRAAVGTGLQYTTGAKGGSETVALTSQQVPAHTHAVVASTATDTPIANPVGNFFGIATAGAGSAGAPPFNIYAPTPSQPANQVPLHPSTISTAGGGTPHENRQPYAAFRICIATTGLFPSRS